MGHLAGWAWFFGALLLIGVVLIVTVVVRIAAGGVRRDGSAGERGSARRLLEDRYARGEISAEEYRQRLGALDEAP